MIMIFRAGARHWAGAGRCDSFAAGERGPAARIPAGERAQGAVRTRLASKAMTGVIAG